MALPSSGAIRLGADVNVELGNSATLTIALGQETVRALFGVASGAIRLGQDSRGKSAVIQGGLYGWGEQSLFGGFFNLYGLGLGNATNYSSPVQVGSLTTWSSVSAAFVNTMAIKTDGTLWGWGAQGFFGPATPNLGLGDQDTRSSPVQVGSLTNWSKIDTSAGSAVAITTNGALYAWGQNPGGELGLLDTVHRSSPVQVGSLTNWSKVKMAGTGGGSGGGPAHLLAVKTDGTLWTCGYNSYGQLGLLDSTSRSSPTQIGSGTNWSTVEAGNVSLAIKTDGSLWSWGGNGALLGYTAASNVSSPTQIGSLTNWSKISSSHGHVLAIKTDGTLWAWGISSAGELGYLVPVTFDFESSPVQVGSLTSWKQVSATDYTAAAIKTDGTLWTWGHNEDGSGVLGLSDNVNRSSPTQVGSLTNWKQADINQYNCGAVKTDGTLWQWGIIPAASTVSSPTQVGSLTNWSQVSTSHNLSFAIKTDNTLWAWGSDNFGFGMFGNGSRSYTSSSPVQIGSLTNWKQVSTGYTGAFSAAIKTDGTLWVWGVGDLGQLGLGTQTRRSSPTQVGSGTNWRQVTTNGGYFGKMLAVKTDGTLWGCGYNSTGSLGLNDIVGRSSLTQVGSGTNWLYVTTDETGNTFAEKTDGTLWAWGVNNFGSLGLGDSDGRSSPVQVGMLMDWASGSTGATGFIYDKISAGVAIKTDSTLWGWGHNLYGQKGYKRTAPGITGSSVSPQQVGSGTTWSEISAGDKKSFAIKTDGTLWAWGQGSGGSGGFTGVLGLSDTNSRSSPTQVGALTGWKVISSGTYHTMAIK